MHTYVCKMWYRMIDKDLDIGIFPEIMVRALVIMMVGNYMLDHTPPLL